MFCMAAPQEITWHQGKAKAALDGAASLEKE
jgi:hypothetical protein